MANSKITALTADTTPTSDDLIVTVNDPAGTPANKKVTLGDAITKAHGLSAGLVKAASGSMSVVAAPTGTVVGTSDSQALTNKDLSGAGNTFPTLNQDTTGKSAKTDALNSATTVVNVSSAAAPSANQVLTATDSTHATWQTPASGGGQTLVTKVVAASGGDYTTLGAALSAASDGWTIWVKPGTYSESAITNTNNNITIIGGGRFGTTISMTTTNFSMSGTGTVLRDIGFSFSTGTMTVSGASSLITNCYLLWSGATSATALTISGTSGQLIGSYIDTQANTYSSGSNVSLGMLNGLAESNVFHIRTSISSTTTGTISTNADNLCFSGNTIIGHNASSGGAAVATASDWVNITGNNFRGIFSSIKKAIYMGGQGSIVGNTFNISGSGATIVIHAANDPTTISGNSIYAQAGGIAIQLDSNNISCTGNSINGNGTTGVNVNAGNDNVITGNRIVGYTTGVVVGAVGRNRTIVSGNALNGNTTGLTDSGTGTVTSGANS